MRILFANKFFFHKGGASIIFLATAELLKKRGHEVVFFSMEHPENIASEFSRYFVSNVEMGGQGGLLDKVKAAGRIQYSFEAKRKIKKLIRDFRPDIAHLHNIYHQLSPSIIDALKDEGVPIVMTLHDYKLVCPAYRLYNEGGTCNECGGGRYYKAFFNRCAKGSFLKSAVNTFEMYLHHKILGIYEKVDVFIPSSRFLASKIEEMGFKGKMEYLPNFIALTDYEPSYSAKDRSVVFHGRLSDEKGLFTLVEAAKGLKGINVKIIGDGPLKEELASKIEGEGINNVSLLGFMSGNALKEEIRGSLFEVITSEWYENNPRAVLEAFALGKPAIGSRIGGIPELVRDNETGFTYEPGNPGDLREKIMRLADDDGLISKMGRNARALIEKGFNEEAHYKRLIEIYSNASGRKRM